MVSADKATQAGGQMASAAELTRHAALLGADWGSTGLRLFLIGADGAVLAERASDQGSTAMNGSAAAYLATLETLAGDWLAAAPELPLVVCGMAGSKHGWHEVPYATCPAEVDNLLADSPPLPPLPPLPSLNALPTQPPLHGATAAAAQAAAGMGSSGLAGGRRMAIVPGLLFAPETAAPDVLRGEETQMAGALALHPALATEACIVMPGTHSKWARLRDNTVLSFATHMTGELYALLNQHSVLNRLMTPAPARPAATAGSTGPAGTPQQAAFEQAVRAARDDEQANLAHQLFAVRTLGLTERLPGEALADYMSGLLIGHELRSGLAWRAAAGMQQAPLVLIGEPKLCARYAQALAVFGVTPDHIFPNTAPAGLWALARRAGLLRPAQE